MKRISNWIAGMSVCMAGIISAQAQTFQPGDITFSAGYGFPSFTKTIFNVAEGENVGTTFIGPLFVKAEFAINETVGFGMDFAYSHGSATYQTSDSQVDSILYNTNFKYTAYSALARFNFHFGHSTSFDPYTGVGLGYRNTKYTYTGNDPNQNPSDLNGFNHFGLDFTIGARMYLTPNIGIYGEVGIAKAPIQVGLVARF